MSQTLPDNAWVSLRRETYGTELVKGASFSSFFSHVACPSPLVGAFILWGTRGQPGKGTLVKEARDQVLDICRSEL